MSDRCSICYEDVDDGVACGECSGSDGFVEMGRTEERKKIVAWLRTTPRAGGVLVSIASSQDIARLADAIERGEHDPTDSPSALPEDKR